jgi:hypothetical protein
MIASFEGNRIAPNEGARLDVFFAHHGYQRDRCAMKNARLRGRF